MSLVKRLKTLLGFNGSSEGQSDEPAAVTVEHDPTTHIDSELIDGQDEDADEPAVEDDHLDEPDDADDVDDVDETPEVAAPEPADGSSDHAITDISGIGPSYAERLEGAGVTSVGQLADSTATELAAETDISEKRIAGWIDQANEMTSVE